VRLAWICGWQRLTRVRDIPRTARSYKLRGFATSNIKERMLECLRRHQQRGTARSGGCLRRFRLSTHTVSYSESFDGARECACVCESEVSDGGASEVSELTFGAPSEGGFCDASWTRPARVWHTVGSVACSVPEETRNRNGSECISCES